MGIGRLVHPGLRAVTLTVVSLFVFLGLFSAGWFVSAAEARTSMSCDAHWDFVDLGQPNRLDYDSIKWKKKPKKCTHEINGYTYGQVNLVGMKWRRWGKRRATAVGFHTANHYDSSGKLPRVRTRVTVRGRRLACPRISRKLSYYTQMRIHDKGSPKSEWLQLFQPEWRC